MHCSLYDDIPSTLNHPKNQAVLTIFLTHTPLRTRQNPIMHLIISSILMIMKTLSAGKAVNLESTYAAGTDTAHEKQLSNKKVMAVLPPDLMVKYETLA